MQETTTKTVAIVVVGAGADNADVKDVIVHAGMSVRQVLDQIGLEGYRLSRGRGTPFFDDGDNLFGLVQDGEKLFASTLADQGR